MVLVHELFKDGTWKTKYFPLSTKYKRDNVLCLPQVEGSFQQAQEQPVVVGQYSPPRVIEILIIKF